MKSKAQIRQSYRVVTNGDAFRIQHKFLGVWWTMTNLQGFAVWEGFNNAYESVDRAAAEIKMRNWVNKRFDSQPGAWKVVQ